MEDISNATYTTSAEDTLGTITNADDFPSLTRLEGFDDFIVGLVQWMNPVMTLALKWTCKKCFAQIASPTTARNILAIAAADANDGMFDALRLGRWLSVDNNLTANIIRGYEAIETYNKANFFAISAPVSIVMKYKRFLSPYVFHIAVIAGRADVVSALVLMNAPRWSSAAEGLMRMSALATLAISAGNVDILKTLTKNNVIKVNYKPNRHSSNELGVYYVSQEDVEQCARAGHIEMLRHLLANGSPMPRAKFIVDECSIEIIKTYCENDVVNTWCVADVAIKRDRVDILRWILNSDYGLRCDIFMQGWMMDKTKLLGDLGF